VGRFATWKSGYDTNRWLRREMGIMLTKNRYKILNMIDDTRGGKDTKRITTDQKHDFLGGSNTTGDIW